MKKEEFINQLRTELSISMKAQDVSEHIRYYQEYIEIELKKGKCEDDILLELGNPRLLAKSIIEANKYKTDGESVNYGMESEAGDDSDNKRRTKFIKLNGLITTIIIIVILIIIARLFIYALPFIAIGVIVSQFIKFFSSRR